MNFVRLDMKYFYNIAAGILTDGDNAIGPAALKFEPIFPEPFVTRLGSAGVTGGENKGNDIVAGCNLPGAGEKGCMHIYRMQAPDVEAGDHRR